MNILILMAGNDEDFSAKYNMPKYLLNVNNKTLLERNLDILSRLCKNSNDRIYCVIRKADQEKYFFKDMIKVLLPSANVLEVNGDTKGAVCSALYAIKYIDSKEELMIYNGSQLVKADLTNCIQDFQQRKLDVGIIAFNAVDYKYSTLLLDSDNNVIQASEKRPISNCASTGCVYFKNGHEFVKSAMTIIEKNGLEIPVFSISLSCILSR